MIFFRIPLVAFAPAEFLLVMDPAFSWPAVTANKSLIRPWTVSTRWVLAVMLLEAY